MLASKIFFYFINFLSRFLYVSLLSFFLLQFKVKADAKLFNHLFFLKNNFIKKIFFRIGLYGSIAELLLT